MFSNEGNPPAGNVLDFGDGQSYEKVLGECEVN